MTRPGQDEAGAEQPDQVQDEDAPAGQPSVDSGSATRGSGGGSPRRSRRHRRVVAPPTNLSADDSDDTVVPAEEDPGVPGESARDAWIRAQRPPHWG